LAVFRAPIQGFVASAIIECSGAEATEGVATAMNQFGAGQIKMRAVEGAPGQIIISLVGRSREETLKTLDDAASHLVANAGTAPMVPDDVAINRAAQRLSEAEENERKARTAYELWRRRADEAEREAHERASTAKPGLGSPTLSPQPKTSQQALNPEWAELVHRVEVLRAERRQLLSTRTDAHPTVIDVEIRIREAEQALASIEQFLSPSQAGDSSPAKDPQEPKNAASTTHLPRETPLPDRDEGEQLKTAWDQAVAYLTEARQAYRQATETQVPAATVEARIATPAKIVGIAGGDLQFGWVVAVALASLGVGLAMARAGSHTSQSSLFASIDEITQALKVPVIASLSTGDGPTIPKRSPNRVRLARLLSRAAAIAVIVLAGMFAYAAAIDPLVLHVAASDPVQAYAFAIDLVWPL
jgi:hypothetical protein